MKSSTKPVTEYICHLYQERYTGPFKHALVVETQMVFKGPQAAKFSAENAYSSGVCVGAEAFKTTIDPETGEETEFLQLAQLGRVPQYWNGEALV